MFGKNGVNHNSLMMTGCTQQLELTLENWNQNKSWCYAQKCKVTAIRMLIIVFILAE